MFSYKIISIFRFINYTVYIRPYRCGVVALCTKCHQRCVAMPPAHLIVIWWVFAVRILLASKKLKPPPADVWYNKYQFSIRISCTKFAALFCLGICALYTLGWLWIRFSSTSKSVVDVFLLRCPRKQADALDVT